MEESSILSGYHEAFKLSEEQIHRIGDDVPIPRFPANEILHLVSVATSYLQCQGPLLHASGDCVIVGDIHGNLHDLFRIFARCGLPPKTKYIFLGDYVDRGEYSLEVITLLFGLYIIFPREIILLRGNHEFTKVNRQYGFHSQLESQYGAEGEMIWESFNSAFNHLPFSCVLDSKVFLVHAGIESLNITTLKSIENISLPVSNYDNPLIANLVWADPTDSKGLTGTTNQRGAGEVFGSNTLKTFLNVNDLISIVRGHECVNGVQAMWDNKICTVFSSSNYSSNNACGVLCYRGMSRGAVPEIFEPKTYLKANEAFYFNTATEMDHVRRKLRSTQIERCQLQKRSSLMRPILKAAPHRKSLPVFISKSKM